MKNRFLLFALSACVWTFPTLSFAQQNDSLTWLKRWDAPRPELLKFNGQGLALVRQDGENYAIVDTNGRKISEYMQKPTFEHAFWATPYFNAFVAERNGKKFLVSETGNEIDLSLYDAFAYSGEFFCRVMRKGRWGTINVRNGAPLISIEYDRVLSMRGSLGIVEEKGWRGMVNTRNQVIVPFEYKAIGYPVNGLALVGKEKRDGTMKFGWVSTEKKGKKVIKLKYQNADDFDANLAPVQKGDKWGFINPKGKTVVPIQYKSVSPINADWIIVTDERDSMGVIDVKNKVIAKTIHENIVYADGDYALFSKAEKYGLLNKFGRAVVPPVYEYVEKYTTAHIVALNEEGQKGLVDIKNDTFLPFKYNNIEVLINENPKKVTYLKAQTASGKYEVYTPSLKLLEAEAYSVAHAYCDNSIDQNRILIEKDGKSGVMTFSGNWVIPMQDSLFIANCNCGVYKVKKRKEAGFYLMNEDHQFLTTIPYDALNYLGENRWKGTRADKHYILDMYGNMYTDKSFPYAIVGYRYGFLAIGHNDYNALGLLDETGKIILSVDSAYTNINPLNEDWVYYHASKEGKSYFYHTKTKQLIDLKTQYQFFGIPYNAKGLAKALADLKITEPQPNTEYKLVRDPETFKIGVENKAGEIIVPTTMDKISPVWDGKVFVQGAEYQGIIKLKK